MQKDYAELSPIRLPHDYFDAIEEKIKSVFKYSIYLPLLKSIGEKTTVLNSEVDDFEPIARALQVGRITYNRGTFSGKFDASISKALKKFGARWDMKQSTFKLTLSDLPLEAQIFIKSTSARFEQKLSAIDSQLEKILPDEIADKIKVADSFDKILWKVDKEFEQNVKNITVVPSLSDTQRKRISKEWQENLQLFVKDFTEKEVQSLRESVKKSYFAGNRYGSLVESIQKSFGVTVNKAKFLAQQESKLLSSKFQEVRYGEAGVDEYKWNHVTGTAEHPVRPRHFQLGEDSKRGTIFRFSDPPITTEPGQPVRRNNPGQDFRCRCFAIPIVRFKKD